MSLSLNVFADDVCVCMYTYLIIALNIEYFMWSNESVQNTFVCHESNFLECF